jgi:hypothetical protein
MAAVYLEFDCARFDQGHRPHDGVDRNYAKGVELAILSTDRNVFAWQESIGGRTYTGLVVVLVGIVVEYPARALDPAGRVDEAADLILFALPKSPRATIVPIFSPKRPASMCLRPQAVE